MLMGSLEQGVRYRWVKGGRHQGGRQAQHGVREPNKDEDSVPT